MWMRMDVRARFGFSCLPFGAVVELLLSPTLISPARCMHSTKETIPCARPPVQQSLTRAPWRDGFFFTQLLYLALSWSWSRSLPLLSPSLFATTQTAKVAAVGVAASARMFMYKPDGGACAPARSSPPAYSVEILHAPPRHSLLFGGRRVSTVALRGAPQRCSLRRSGVLWLLATFGPVKPHLIRGARLHAPLLICYFGSASVGFSDNLYPVRRELSALADELSNARVPSDARAIVPIAGCAAGNLLRLVLSLLWIAQAACG